jgi:hypothetical protein
LTATCPSSSHVGYGMFAIFCPGRRS